MRWCSAHSDLDEFSTLHWKCRIKLTALEKQSSGAVCLKGTADEFEPMQFYDNYIVFLDDLLFIFKENNMLMI